MRATPPPPDSEVGLMASIVMITLQKYFHVNEEEYLYEVIINCTTQSLEEYQGDFVLCLFQTRHKETIKGFIVTSKDTSHL